MKLVNAGDMYCVTDVIGLRARPYSGGGIWIHYVPSVGEHIKLNSGWYNTIKRESICSDKEGNYCLLTLVEVEHKKV